jgi:hypothetical protein
VRPVTLVDGFYQGSDKREQALQHDCVTMVAGGVAISPYLSLVPALLSRLVKGGDVKTKTIVLRWVVREQGLCAFVVKNYIDPTLKRARSLDLGISLAIHVYVTGWEKKVDVSSVAMDTLEGSSRMMISTTLKVDDSEKMESGSSASDEKETSSDTPGDRRRRYGRALSGDGSRGAAPLRESNLERALLCFVHWRKLSGILVHVLPGPARPMNYYDLSEHPLRRLDICRLRSRR